MSKKILGWSLGLLALFILFVFSLIGCGHIRHAIHITPIDTLAKPQLEGTLLALSDADQIGTAYADGIVNKIAGLEDTLTIFQFQPSGEVKRQLVHASNSVISWPSLIDVSSGQRYIYVAETRAPFPGDKKRVKNVYTDTPEGTLMTLINLSSGQVVQTKPMGKNLESASLNRQGDLLVSGSNQKGKEIVIAQLDQGKIGQIYYFEAQLTPENKEGVRTIEFHPSQDVIAVNIDNRKVAFYKILRANQKLDLKRMGEPIEVAKRWSVGNWHPSGQYFILSDVAWGQGSMGYVFNGRGKLVSVRFDLEGNHQIASKAKVGLSPEGFDLSPDGNWAIVANMRRTYLPQGLPYSLFAARGEASLSLVKVDASTGELEVMGDEYGFEGELPEDAVFDPRGKTIAVAIYNKRHEKMPQHGYIEFWQREGEKLIRTNLKIPVTRGVHNLFWGDF